MSSAIPSVAPWTGVGEVTISQIRDTASGRCWDSNTVSLGAQLFLQDCHSVTPTQTFNFINLPDRSVVLSTVNDKKLCVEMGTRGVLSLQECRNGYSSQRFKVDNTGFSLQSDATACIAANAGRKLSKVACTSKAATSIVPLLAAPRPMPAYKVTQIKFSEGNSCLQSVSDSSTFERSDVSVAACNGSPAQSWYWHWGQIRNVESGLCLDAPRADAADTDTRVVSLSACPSLSITQVWIKTATNTLINGASTNCIHLVNTNSVQLGTDYCGSKDVLKGPKSFTGLDSFTADMGEPACTKPRARKDFRDLSADEQKAFFTGIDTLFNTPSLVGRKNRYHDYVALHGAGARWFHGTPYFLPWHRFYTALIEQDLQVALKNSSFAFPFWNWGADASTWNLPATGVLAPGKFGTSGNGNEGDCVIDDFSKKGWAPTRGSCLIRGYFPRRSDTSVSLYTEDYMLLALQVNPRTQQNYTDFNGFRELLESLPHNNFHMSITGSIRSSHMSDPAVAVNDPIFFLHHNNMDRHWQYFQNAHKELADSFNGEASYPPWTDKMVKVQKSDILVGFNVPVSKAMGVPLQGGYLLCHTFQPFSKSIASVSIRHSQLARRSKIRRRQSTTGNDLLETLDPAVAGKVIQDDIAIKADTAEPVDKANLPVPERITPTKMTDDFLDMMQTNMHVNKDRIRELEEGALKLLEKLRAQTDKVMADKFGKNVTNATFEQHAVAVKVAIAEIALSKE
ncbi:hypothetical protein BC829DRAFT_419063 [Chytridium lagenaria]|nr:hypothetical protein BC829DRAFT_419063 [Chytridium lagenaria]